MLGSAVASTKAGVPTSVLDASALMALIHGEDGKAAVAAALAGRSTISVVNWAEVLSKVAERGGDPVALELDYREWGFIGRALAIEGMTGGLRPSGPPASGHDQAGSFAGGSSLPRTRWTTRGTGLDDRRSLGGC